MDEDTRRSAKEKVRLAQCQKWWPRLPAQRAAATDGGGLTTKTTTTNPPQRVLLCSKVWEPQLLGAHSEFSLAEPPLCRTLLVTRDVTQLLPSYLQIRRLRLPMLELRSQGREAKATLPTSWALGHRDPGRSQLLAGHTSSVLSFSL